MHAMLKGLLILAQEWSLTEHFVSQIYLNHQYKNGICNFFYPLKNHIRKDVLYAFYS